MFVVPLIDPLMVSDPADVVTVQSAVCAEGVDRTELTTTWFAVMFALLIVCGSELIDAFVTTRIL